MALSRTKSRITIPAPPPSPIPTGSGSRSAANETFKQFLEKSIHLPQLSLPESRFLSGDTPSPAVIDYRLLTSPGGGGLEAAARMLRSAHEFGAFRIVNHGISGEEILSVVNEAKSVLEDCKEGFDDRRWAEEDGNRETIFQVRRRSDSEISKSTVVQAETHRQISEKMEKIGRKLEEVGEKLREILWEYCMELGENLWDENNIGKKETIFSIYRYNHQTLFERENNNFGKNDDDQKEDRESMMMSLHIPGEHCQFFVHPHQQSSSCFDVGADTIVLTIDKQLQEWSMGKLKSARSEMTFMPDLLGSQTSFSIELKFSNTNLLNTNNNNNNPPPKIISISDQILMAFLLLFLYSLYTYISSFFKPK